MNIRATRGYDLIWNLDHLYVGDLSAILALRAGVPYFRYGQTSF